MCESPFFSITKHGNPVLMLNRYRYNGRTSAKSSKIRWYCTRASLGCRSLAITIDYNIVYLKDEHNHLP
uniref:SFRICE_000682 n=1 Tax=Spodoptera frugiperda TaxID=7108 RepID=A0A2H1V1N1_SPOFR